MRSRFSAFVQGHAAYLLASWHPSTRPARLDLDDRMTWTRLEIVDTAAGGPFERTGAVEFRAHYRMCGEAGVLHERSSFLRSDGQWLYVDGAMRPPGTATASRTRRPAAQ